MVDLGRQNRVYYRTFRDQMKALIDKKGWLWEDLARAIGVSTGRMSHIINGRETRVSEDTIERIAKALGVKPSHFDLYVLKKLPEMGVSAPALVDIGRRLLMAKDSHAFAQIAAKIAA